MVNKKWYKVKHEYNNQINEFCFTSNSLKEAQKRAINHCKNAGTKLINVKLDKDYKIKL